MTKDEELKINAMRDVLNAHSKSLADLRARMKVIETENTILRRKMVALQREQVEHSNIDAMKEIE